LPAAASGEGMGFARSVPLVSFVATALLAGCGAPQAAEQDIAPVREWRIGTAEHIALWYHGLAYTARAADTSATPPRARNGPLAGVDTLPPLPLYRPGYVDSMTALKRAAGVFPTELDKRAAEFAREFEGEAAYSALHFLPLYFRDGEALFGAIRVWHQAEGDPQRVTGAAAQAVAFLSALFRTARQRDIVTAWANVLLDESRVFYHEHWRAVQPELAALASAVSTEWQPAADSLRDFLLFANLRGGELFLVPALGPEGRIVTRGVQRPRVAIGTPPPGRPRDALWPFIRELIYPLTAETVREYLAPVRIRELGETAITSRGAVRAGALLVDRALPADGAAYLRFFLQGAGHELPAGRDELDAAFVRAFPVPTELQAGLEEMVQRALAGI